MKKNVEVLVAFNVEVEVPETENLAKFMDGMGVEITAPINLLSYVKNEQVDLDFKVLKYETCRVSESYRSSNSNYLLDKKMSTLKKKFTPVIEVDFLGTDGLAYYIQHCYRLPGRFELSDVNNDQYFRIEVKLLDPEKDTYEVNSASKSIREGWCYEYELESVMCQMCNDDFLQPGIYLVSLSW